MSHLPVQDINGSSSWVRRILFAEILGDRERYHCRTGSIGISVKKNNVFLALFPGLLHGAYKDWNELIENKETKGVWGMEWNQHSWDMWILLLPKILCHCSFPPCTNMHKSTRHSHYRHLIPCKTNTDKQRVANLKLTFSIQDFFLFTYFYMCVHEMQLKILVAAICYAHYELQSVCKDANWIKLFGIFYNTKSAATVVWKSDSKKFLISQSMESLYFWTVCGNQQESVTCRRKRQHTCKTPAYLVHTQDRRKWFIICPLNFSEHSV